MPSVSIAPHCDVGGNVFLGKNVSVGAKSKIMDTCSIQPNVIINEKSFLNEGIRVMPNSIINSNFKNKNMIISGSPARYLIYDKK